MKRIAIKVGVGLIVLGVLGVLFVRSARNLSAEPYEIGPDQLMGWTLTVDDAPAASGAVVSLRPPRELQADLFSQVFRRSGVSLSGPAPAEMPLVLLGEFDRSVAGTLTPQALLVMARVVGLESATVRPRCLAERRVSDPGINRQVFFLRFDLPAFAEFRQHVAQQVRGTSGHAAAFDPEALSPVMIVAASEPTFSRWLPLRLQGADDCLAPVATR